MVVLIKILFEFTQFFGFKNDVKKANSSRRRLEGDIYTGMEAGITECLFCLQVDWPSTSGSYKWGVGRKDGGSQADAYDIYRGPARQIC